MSKDKKLQLSRRQFLGQSACASMGLTSMISTLASLRLMNASVANAAPGGDYKAIICLFLAGGNDSNNLLVPRSGTLRTNYDAGRGVLAIPSVELNALAADNTTDDLGTHPACADLANLFNAGDLAFTANLGSLAYPFANRDEYLNSLVPRPPQLFSHSDQVTQWQSSLPDQPFLSGWGGRMAELLHASYNPSSNVSMSISLSGSNNFQVGTSGNVAQFNMGSGGVNVLDGYGSNYSSALEVDGVTYRDTDQGWRLRGLQEVAKLTHEHLLEDSFADVVMNARDTEGFIGSALDDATTAEGTGGFTFDNLFANAGATSGLANRMKMIARLIAGHDSLANNRQIFFVDTGGYDTHQNMIGSHSNLMTDLNNSVKGFWDSIVQLGLEDDVLVFTASDFNRTFTPNGEDASAGS
ncbi:MAG: hypothetical protein ACI9TH_001894, partial [Kiritimatiellia bacterium]